MIYSEDQKGEIIEAALVAMDELEEGGSLTSIQRLRAALKPSLLPTDDDLTNIAHDPQNGHQWSVDQGRHRIYAHALRLALDRFGHHEGCGEGCAYCDVTIWATEMENR